jgi:hypothetical protein
VKPKVVEKQENAIKINPNPAQGYINVNIPDGNIGSDLLIIDAIGRIVLEQRIINSEQIINISFLSAGIYSCKIGREKPMKLVIVQP